MDMPASSLFPCKFWPKWPSASRLQVPCRPLTWMRLFASAAVCTPAVQGGGYNPLAQHGRPAVEGLLVFTQSTVRAKQSRIDSRQRYDVRVQCCALLIRGGWQCKSRLGHLQSFANDRSEHINSVPLMVWIFAYEFPLQALTGSSRL